MNRTVLVPLFAFQMRYVARNWVSQQQDGTGGKGLGLLHKIKQQLEKVVFFMSFAFVWRYIAYDSKIRLTTSLIKHKVLVKSFFFHVTNVGNHATLCNTSRCHNSQFCSDFCNIDYKNCAVWVTSFWDENVTVWWYQDMIWI